MGHEVIDAVKAARLISEYSQEVQSNKINFPNIIGGIFHAHDFNNWIESDTEGSVQLFIQKDSQLQDCFFLKAKHSTTDEEIYPFEIFESPSLNSELDLLSFIHRQRKGGIDLTVQTNAENIDHHQLKLLALGIDRASTFEVMLSKGAHPLNTLFQIPKTEVLFIRYFFGLRKSQGKHFSLILAPVDIAGRNILVLPDGSAARWIELN